MAVLASWIRKASSVWEAVQVELHGQYSTQRLDAVRQYIASTTLLHAIAVLVLTPLPCLCLIGLDALPLVSPKEGASKQTWGFWLRSFFVGWSGVFFATLQVGRIVPSLRMTQRRLWCISLSISAALLGFVQLPIWAIGFPVPFTFQVQTVPIAILVGSAWWLSWKDILRADPLVKQDFFRFLKLCRTFGLALIMYVAYNVAYNQLRGRTSQLAFSMLLPVLKMLLKVRLSSGVYHLEDLAPTHVVSSIDVFHALFVSLTMQQTPTSTLTLSMFMAVDVVQGVIAIYEVRTIVTRLNELRLQVGDKEEEHTTTSTFISLNGGYLACVSMILEANTHVRQHPSVALPRHLRDRLPHPHSTSTSMPGQPRVSNTTAVWPVEQLQRGPSVEPIECKLLASHHTQPLPMAAHELAQLEYTQKALKLLHMTEFYVLIEYVELMIAALYAAYLYALSKLPNRVFYPQLAALSDAQMQTVAAQVAKYASVELLSLIVFFWVLRWQIQGFSPVRQLAFALQTHWIEIQAAYMITLVLAVQLSLEHNGADFTFQFKWLHHNKSDTSV